MLIAVNLNVPSRFADAVAHRTLALVASKKFSVSQLLPRIRCDLVQEEMFGLLSVSSIRGLFESRFWYPGGWSKAVEHSLSSEPPYAACATTSGAYRVLDRDSPYVRPQLPRPRMIML